MDSPVYELVRDNVKVTLEWIGEGLTGDYNSHDPHDEPLLRFYVLHKDEGSGRWEYIDDASYCTQLPASATHDQVQEALSHLMEAFYPMAASYPHSSGLTSAARRMSHISLLSLSGG